jgi:hypothetical protein
MIRILLVLSIVLMPLVSNAQQLVLGVVDDLKNAKQEARESVDKLIDVKNNEELSEEEKLRLETEASRTALLDVFKFSALETQALIDKVKDAKDLTVEYIELQGGLLEDLNEFLGAYADFQDRLAAAENLEAIKELAAEFKNWRENVYGPVVQAALDFISVFQSRNLLKMAEGRFEKISQDLRRWKFSRIIKTDLLEPLLSQAGVSLKEARALYNQAAALLLENKEDKPPVKSFLDETLLKIRDAYKRFLEMSDLVKKMLTKNPV